MGYYSYFIVDYADAKWDAKEEDHVWRDLKFDGYESEIIQQLREICGWDIWFEEEMKWYDEEGHMTELSEKFPDKIFRVHVNGEDDDDDSYKYYFRGRMQTCKAIVTYPEMNYRKMKKSKL